MLVRGTSSQSASFFLANETKRWTFPPNHFTVAITGAGCPYALHSKDPCNQPLEWPLPCVVRDGHRSTAIQLHFWMISLNARDTLKQSTIELISTRLSTVDWHDISESAREPPSWWRSYQCESKSFLSIDQYSNNTTWLFHSIPNFLSLYKSSQFMLIEIHIVEHLIQILYHIYPAGCGIARVGASPLSKNDNRFSVS